MVGSNNYLGLAGDPRIHEAMKEAIDIYGSGTCGPLSQRNPPDVPRP